MRTKVINKCKKTYRIDVEELVKNIVGRVPGKFLEDLSHISLLDLGAEDYPMCRYIVGNKGSEVAQIEIYLNNPDFTRIPFFSPLAINIHFLLAVNQHIEHLKAKTEDRDIQAVDTSKINYEWMHLGVWNPFFVVFRSLRYLITPRRLFKMVLRRKKGLRSLVDS
jgi:hypothetical protein